MHDRRHAVDQNVPDRGDGRGQRRAHRRPGLHDAVGNAAGEIVLKERPALPHHVPMRLPADHAGERRRDRLVGDQIARQRHRRPRDQHDDRHADEPRPAVRRGTVGRRLRHHGDDAAHEPRHRAVGQRHQHLDDEQRGEQPFRLPGKVPQKGDQCAGRLRIFRDCRRRQEFFKKREHCGWVRPHMGCVNRGAKGTCKCVQTSPASGRYQGRSAASSGAAYKPRQPRA